ncbi:DNA repair protein RecO [Candidatus Uhrbacteria bacterium]|nr:DNA repair protein RecO [Candidatus Uhrbacteria bacterium]
MTYNTTGIILRYRDIGEYDRIYSVLTADHGKVDAWAQGVRKPQSKLVAHLQPLYLCDLMFARGRRFDRIAQVRVQNRWPELWGDLEKMGEAMYAASLVDLVLRPGTKEWGVFELLLDVLKLLHNPPQPSLTLREGAANNPPLKIRGGAGGVMNSFALKLLKESGFGPELRNCVLCKAGVEGLSRHFDAIRGGVLCEECFHKTGTAAFPVSSLTLDTLDTILVSPLSHLEMPETVARELKTIANAMIRAHFGEEPKARYFVESIAKELPEMAGV